MSSTRSGPGRAALLVAAALAGLGTGVEAGAQPPPRQIAPAPGAALLTGPAGDTLAILVPGVLADVLGEEGEWLRLRLDAWLHRGDTARVGAAHSGALTLSALRANPELYRGQIVRWRVQHLALQRADSLRTDIGAGEHYLLVRDPGGEPGFVYAIVPPHLVAAAANLAPLQRVEIVGRVRDGRSSLTGHPLLELFEIHP